MCRRFGFMANGKIRFRPGGHIPVLLARASPRQRRVAGRHRRRPVRNSREVRPTPSPPIAGAESRPRVGSDAKIDGRVL